MRIEYRQSGGISGGSRQILVENGQLTFSSRKGNDNPIVQYARALKPDELQALGVAVERLEDVNPRQWYGSAYALPSDCMTQRLCVQHRKTLSLEAITCSRDEPPAEFYAVERTLWELMRADPSGRKQP